MGLPGMKEQGAAPRRGVGVGSSGLNAQPSGLPLKRPSLKETAGGGVLPAGQLLFVCQAWRGCSSLFCQPTLEGR